MPHLIELDDLAAKAKEFPETQRGTPNDAMFSHVVDGIRTEEQGGRINRIKNRLIASQSTANFARRPKKGSQNAHELQQPVPTLIYPTLSKQSSLPAIRVTGSSRDEIKGARGTHIFKV